MKNLLLLLALLLCLTACGETRYETFRIGPASEREIAAAGTKGVALTAVPEYTENGWVLQVEYALGAAFDAADAFFGADFALEYFADGAWHRAERQPHPDGYEYAVNAIAYILSPEFSPRTESYGLLSYGTVLYEGNYRFVTEITIDGEDLLYAAEFTLQGEGVIPRS